MNRELLLEARRLFSVISLVMSLQYLPRPDCEKTKKLTQQKGGKCLGELLQNNFIPDFILQTYVTCVTYYK